MKKLILLSLLPLALSFNAQAAKQKKKVARAKTETQVEAPKMKSSTQEAPLASYAKTHTCDLSAMSPGTFKVSEFKCLNSEGVAPDSAEIELGSILRWTFTRDGEVSFAKAYYVAYAEPADFRGLCVIRAYSDVQGYMGVNNATGKLEVILPVSNIKICQGADVEIVEQVMVLEKK